MRVLVLTLANALALPACGPAPSPSAPPSGAVIVLVDSLRADRLSLYGHGRATDAGLERFAGHAALFERCFATAPWASPSVASALTGLDPDRHGLERGGDALSSDGPTLASWLGERGFRTAAFTAGVGLDPARDATRGFQTVVHREAVKGARAGADRLVAAAVQWLAADQSAPFLMVLQLRDPRAPYGPPREWEGSVALAAPSPPLDEADEGARQRWEYDRGVRFALDRVGELLDELTRRGLGDSTFVAVAGSAGEELG